LNKRDIWLIVTLKRNDDDLADFSELESCISELKTPKERGDAFEVFAEAYCATTRKVQASEVYPCALE